MPNPPTVADVVRHARAQIGNGENPAGSKRTAWSKDLDARYGTSMGINVLRDGCDFCATFVAWCYCAAAGWPRDWPLVAAGVTIPSFFTPADVNQWKKAGRWTAGDRGGQPGDFIYFDWRSDPDRDANHTGLVVEAPGGGVYRTVEANAGPLVGLYERSGVDILGFGRPNYSTAVAPPPAPTVEDAMATVIIGLADADQLPAQAPFPGSQARWEGVITASGHVAPGVRWIKSPARAAALAALAGARTIYLPADQFAALVPIGRIPTLADDGAVDWRPEAGVIPWDEG